MSTTHRKIWSFVPSQEVYDLYVSLEANMSRHKMILNRSAFINRSLEETFQRMKPRLLKKRDHSK